MDITVRHSEPEDYRVLHCIFSGPRAIAGTLQMPFPRAEMWRKRLSEPPEGLYSLVACREGEVLGSPSARRPPLPAGACVTSAASGWPYAMTGRGVGTELMEAALDLADNWLNLTRIELHVYVDNAPAIALYEKFGFEVEGTHRYFAFRNGEYVDAYSIARLRDR